MHKLRKARNESLPYDQPIELVCVSVTKILRKLKQVCNQQKLRIYGCIYLPKWTYDLRRCT